MTTPPTPPEKSELLPCPFCAAIPVKYDTTYTVTHLEHCMFRKGEQWIVGERQLVAWNTRTTPQPVKGEMKSAEEWYTVYLALAETLESSGLSGLYAEKANRIAFDKFVKAIQQDALASRDKEVEELKCELQAEKEAHKRTTETYLKDQLPAGVKDWEQVWSQRVQMTKDLQLANAKIAVMSEHLKKVLNCCANGTPSLFLVAQTEKILTNLPAKASELIEDGELVNHLESLVFTNREGEKQLGFDFTMKDLRTAFKAIKSAMSGEK